MDSGKADIANSDIAVSDIAVSDIAVSDIAISDIVVSLNGRDKGKPFFVVQREDIYALLCDGKSRRVDKPKRKKLKHLRLESKSDCRTALKLKDGFKVTNSELRRALAEYQTNIRGEKEVCK
jgi:ribosomal protein L14E/L6E/L27E